MHQKRRNNYGLLPLLIILKTRFRENILCMCYKQELEIGNRGDAVKKSMRRCIWVILQKFVHKGELDNPPNNGEDALALSLFSRFSG